MGKRLVGDVLEKINRLSKYNLISSFFSSFFLYQLIYTIVSPTVRLYTLDLSLKNLLLQFGIMAIFMILTILIENRFRIKNTWLIFYTIVIAYLLIFMLKMPIPTISLGAFFIIGIVLLFIKDKVDKKIFKILIISSGVIGIFKIIILFLNPKLLEGPPDLFKAYSDFNLLDPTGSNFIIYGIFAVLIFTTLYLIIGKFLGKKENKILKYIIYIVLVIGIIQVLYLTLIMVSRVLTFNTPTYDMGIFTQMFHNLDKGYGAVTTVERDGILSHFKVHISPIYYLLLPFFKIWPSPINLQILQIVIVVSGIIPLYKLAREFKLKKAIALLIVGLYLVIPSLNGGNLYDLHENCFLAPLLIWLFYSVQKNNKILIILFTILILMVKEDAGLYIVFIGLYFLFNREFRINRKDRIFNLLLLIIVPILVFFIFVGYLNSFGDGAMLDRYANLSSYKDLGIKGILISFIQNFSYYISLIFKTNKIYYLTVVLGSMAFLPVVQKHWYNYFLICPLIVVNLLPDYQYQHDLGFQYNYGSTTLLIIMVLLSLKYIFKDRIIKRKSKKLPLYLLLIGFVFSSTIIFNLYKINSNPVMELKNREQYVEIENALDKIPHDSKVLSQNFYTTYLSKNIFELYDLQFHNNLEFDEEIDYIVVPKNLSNEKDRDMKELYIEKGYKLSDFSNEFIEIYNK